MKKLITLILGITLAYSCSTNTSSNNNAAVTDIDGNIYQTITICSQTWTKTNLNVSKYRNGDVIPQVTDATQWAALTTGAWCYYNNDPANGVIYGKLYNWYAVNDPRGLAPTGFHIPSETEWTTLSDCLGGDVSVIFNKMVETGNSHWTTPHPDATNSSGFTAFAAGYRHYLGNFSYFGQVAKFSSSSLYDLPNMGLTSIWIYTLDSVASNTMYNTSGDINNGFSVRCLKD